MTASLHSSTTDSRKDYDLEVFDRAEDADVPAGNDRKADGKGPSPWEVTLEKSEDPRALAVWYKWATVLTVSCGATYVTCALCMVSAIRHIHPGRI